MYNLIFSLLCSYRLIFSAIFLIGFCIFPWQIDVPLDSIDEFFNFVSLFSPIIPLFNFLRSFSVPLYLRVCIRLFVLERKYLIGHLTDDIPNWKLNGLISQKLTLNYDRLPKCGKNDRCQWQAVLPAVKINCILLKKTHKCHFTFSLQWPTESQNQTIKAMSAYI